MRVVPVCSSLDAVAAAQNSPRAQDGGAATAAVNFSGWLGLLRDEERSGGLVVVLALVRNEEGIAAVAEGVDD